MTSNTTGRHKLQFLGYDLGTFADWDGDEISQQWIDWRPGPDVKFRPPNSRGNELMLVMNLDTGDLEIQDYECPEYVEEGRGWTTLAKLTWRELIGHPKSSTPTSPTPGDHISTTSSVSAG